LSRWKNRHGIRELHVSGNILSDDNVASDDFKTKFEKFISDEDLMPCQIFDANETGLNYKMFPKKTLASKLDSVAKGHKVKKERVTLRPCSNASGDLKFPLLVIGKSAKPRAFKNVNMSALPAQYTSQKSAWMNGNIFKNWFFKTFMPTTKTFLKQKKTSRKSCIVYR
jgi:hypothetical protein